MNSLLARVRRTFGRSADENVAYRITLEREPDADREAYVNRVESITEGLEASIRDAGANVFDSVYVSRTGGPYSQTMVEIEEKKEQLMELDAWLDPVERFGPPLLSRKSVGDVRKRREKIDHQLDKLLHNERPRTESMFVYSVSFEPTSSETIEAIASEFDRLSTLDGVEAVEYESNTPDDDPRNSINFQAQEEKNHD